MSEANVPFNPQGSESTPSASSQKPAAAQPVQTRSMGDRTQETARNQRNQRNQQDRSGHLPLDTNPIFDASTLDEGAFEESDANVTNQPLATNLSSIAAWSKGEKPQELPNLSELITLIQELNQCNSGLMERVTQLEEALECSQSALQAEVGRTQEVQSAYNAQDWAAVQEQITTLFNQLEFAHQTNQRQQILIETLTGQLESSQERVAELEREAALLQQRYDEQGQTLQKAENTSRDLQARLQRQQRYTLQFKAALEKSLDMPAPQYDLATISPEVPIAPAEAPFPKVPRIQPWSAQAHASAKASAWMKLQNVELSSTPEPIAEPAQPQLEPPNDRPSTTHLNLPSFGMPLLQVSDEAQASPLRQEIEKQVQQLTNDPSLKQQLDAAVKPLADMLAEALLADSLSEVPPAQSEPASQDYTADSSPEFSTELPSSTAEEMLSSVMADAEDALWQDLARLIDVSTEDVVKASLAGDIAAFESIDFNAMVDSVSAPAAPDRSRVQSSDSPQVAPAPTIAAATLNSDRQSADSSNRQTSESGAAVAPVIRRIAQGVSQGVSQSASQGDRPAAKVPPQPTPAFSAPDAAETSAELEDCIPALANSGWPSPVVYPLRPTKKRQSLAMVDLPTFPQG